MGKEGVHNLSKYVDHQRSSSAILRRTPANGPAHLHRKTEFDEVLAQKDKLIVLDCFATWFSDTYPTAAFYKLDVDEVPDVAQELGIRAMPTFILFRNGEKVAEVVGANPKVLEAAIKKEVETEGGEPTKAE
ncbi:MAG: hypothetical protein Q9157_007470 [Trypethelium eluteriae]